MPQDRSTSAGRSPTTRSAVTNGRALFVEGDGRGPWARRYRDLLELHAKDLGGDEVLSEAQRSLIRRAAALAIQCEALEGRMSEGREVDLGEYTTAANALRRLLATIGLERRQRDVPDLQTYLRERQGAAS